MDKPNNEKIDGFFFLMGLTKVIDRVVHDSLVAKTNVYGLSLGVTEFSNFYLKRRKQRMKINKKCYTF